MPKRPRAAKPTKSPNTAPHGSPPSLGWTLAQALDAITGDIPGIALSGPFKGHLRECYGDAARNAVEAGEIATLPDGTLDRLPFVQWAYMQGIALPDNVLSAWRSATRGARDGLRIGSYSAAFASESHEAEHYREVERMGGHIGWIADALDGFPSRIYESPEREYSDALMARSSAIHLCQNVLTEFSIVGIVVNWARLRVIACLYELAPDDAWPLRPSEGDAPAMRARIAAFQSCATKHLPLIQGAQREIEQVAGRTAESAASAEQPAAPSAAGAAGIAQVEVGKEEPQLTDTQSRVLGYLAQNTSGKRPDFRASIRQVVDGIARGGEQGPQRSAVHEALNVLLSRGYVSKLGEASGSGRTWGITDAGKARHGTRI